VIVDTLDAQEGYSVLAHSVETDILEALAVSERNWGRGSEREPSRRAGFHLVPSSYPSAGPSSLHLVVVLAGAGDAGAGDRERAEARTGKGRLELVA
jgi:hypothetical protein